MKEYAFIKRKSTVIEIVYEKAIDFRGGINLIEKIEILLDFLKNNTMGLDKISSGGRNNTEQLSLWKYIIHFSFTLINYCL